MAARKRGDPPRVILVTDPAYADDRIVEVVEACAAALPPRAFGVQLRDKRRDAIALRMFASLLRRVTDKQRAWLIVNGNPELARDVGADGVHLGGDAPKVPDARRVCGDRVFVSIAAHSDEAVRDGVRDGADAALVSPIFTSPGKPPGRGVDAIRSACAVAPSSFRIYALGGVDATNARACIDAGAWGAAAIRALLRAHDPAVEARALYDAITGGAPG